MMLRIRKIMFSQVFQIFPTERLRTIRWKYKNDKNTLKISKGDFFSKKSCGHKKWVFDNRDHFVMSKGIKLTLKLPWRKKTIFQKTSFNQNVTVDKRSLPVTSLPKFFCKFFFAVITRKLNNCDVSDFLEEIWFFGHVKRSFDNLAEFVFLKAHKLHSKSQKEKMSNFQRTSSP